MHLALASTILHYMAKSFRTERLSRGWTLEALAEQCRANGVKADKSHVGHIERGDWAPRPQLREVLCRLLDLPTTYFDRDQRNERRAS